MAKDLILPPWRGQQDNTSMALFERVNSLERKVTRLEDLVLKQFKTINQDIKELYKRVGEIQLGTLSRHQITASKICCDVGQNSAKKS